MSDQVWALIAGAATVIGLRILDYLLPKGRMFRWVRDHTVPDDTVPDDTDPDHDEATGSQ